jgi:hypothetical protein
VDVLEHEKHGSVLPHRGEELRDRGVQPVALGVRLGGDGRRQLLDRECEPGKYSSQLARPGASVLTKLLGIGVADEAIERFRERPVGRRHDRVARPVEDDCSLVGELLGELPNESALAGAGLARNERRAPSLTWSPGEERPEREQFARPTREWERRD